MSCYFTVHSTHLCTSIIPLSCRELDVLQNMNGVLLCVLMASLLRACSAEPDFSQDGPYSTENRKYPFKMGTFTGCSGRQCSITVTITKPRMLPNGTYVAGRAPPFPIIFFLNGFQVITDVVFLLDTALWWDVHATSPACEQLDGVFCNGHQRSLDGPRLAYR